jgi:sulfur carrier protein
MVLNLSVNGQLRSVPITTNPAALDTVLTALAVRRELVAIALNDTIVPRAQWNETMLSAGDRIEIVHFVGGGSHSDHGDLTASVLQPPLRRL